MAVMARSGGVVVAFTSLQNNNSFLAISRQSGFAMATPREACHHHHYNCYTSWHRRATTLMLVSSKKKDEEAETNRKQNLFGSLTEALDFAHVRSQEDPVFHLSGLCCGELVNSQGESRPLDYKSLSVVDRRTALMSSIGLLLSVLLNNSNDHGAADASEFADMPALKGKDYGKTKMRYPDYIQTSSGLQYKDLRIGNGPTPKKGDMVVVDWDGYTIGYYGRIFEARNKTKGGSFEGDDKAFYRFKLGSHEVIPAFEEAISGMSLGGIRRIIVPPELGYPENDYNKSGPRPTTFSGQRALDFVLRNQGLIDKTLLFDIELINVAAS